MCRSSMELTLFQAAQSGLSHRPSFHEESGRKSESLSDCCYDSREEDSLPLVQAQASMVHSSQKRCSRISFRYE